MPSPLFAFGLTSLPMLGWLAAAAAPILIHLVEPAAVSGDVVGGDGVSAGGHPAAHAAVACSSSGCCLLIRTLIIVLFVLAAAEPFWESTKFFFNSGGNTHRVLVLDGSFSMAYKPTEQSRFDRAKELARQIVEESRQGDGFSLIVMAAPPKVLVAAPAVERSEILREIADLPPPCATTDLPATVAAVEQVLETAQRENPRLTRHEVVFHHRFAARRLESAT